MDRDGLNYSTHLIIDRIVFLRICEDRHIEPYGSLRDTTLKPNIYARLQHLFERADEKYNSGLFHFSRERGRADPDTLTPKLNVQDDVLHKFIRRLYWPYGPYDFAVFPADVLGQVYEQFLGRTISLKGNVATVEDKPEVRKSGGVYYTPSHIVRDIVSSTLGPKLQNRSPAEISKKRFSICDPACGSGTFLLEAYQYLLDWHLEHYVNNEPARWTRTRPKRLQRDVAGQWRLTTAERKRILLSHIFGVDIDPQAVEVTKLSLLLKVLEGETEASISEQFELFHDRVLPDLDDNIKCGNSLVGSAFHLSQGSILDDELQRRVNAFDWDLEFAAIADRNGFDVIVGNPPWLMAGYYVADSLPYMKEQFATATGKFDLYYIFLEQAFRLLDLAGSLGMIVPNKFFHTRAAKNLRNLLSRDVGLRKVKDFGLEKVFERATNYSCIILADRGNVGDYIDYSEVTASLDTVDGYQFPVSKLGPEAWNFQDSQALEIFAKMGEVGHSLEDVIERFATGIQSGSDKLLTFTHAEATEHGFEASLLRPMLRGRDVKAYGLSGDPKLLLFPYKEVGDEFVLLSETELRAHPIVYEYLLGQRTHLKNRVWFGKSAEELCGAWYGLMYLERASSFSRPHLLTPSLSKVANFTIGDGNVFATGTAGVTGLVPRSPSLLPYLLGLLNSSLFSVYIAKHSPIYQGGFRKYSAPYLRKLPIKIATGEGNEVDEARQTRIGDLANLAMKSAVLANTMNYASQSRQYYRRRHAAARREIDELALDHYGISKEGKEWVRRHWLRLSANRQSAVNESEEEDQES